MCATLLYVYILSDEDGDVMVLVLLMMLDLVGSVGKDAVGSGTYS